MFNFIKTFRNDLILVFTGSTVIVSLVLLIDPPSPTKVIQNVIDTDIPTISCEIK